MSDVKWAADLFDDLPPEAVITDAVAVIGYMIPSDDAEDNGMRWGAHYSSDTPVSSVVGLLELSKHDLMHPPDPVED